VTYWISLGCAGAELQESVRARILNEIVEQCQSRGWKLSAAHVRANGVQVVLSASEPASDVRRALVSALRGQWRKWNAAAIALNRRTAESAVQTTIGSPKNMMAVFVAGAGW